jgi:periplasmic protein TonB
MATSKDNEVLIAPDGSVAVQTQPFRPDETSARPNPVALEVPVSVNGARTLAGSDKREPFSETTKTVLVFGNGAVIRLSSPVAAGQLLFLTNEKTKKEVVCQVVKSKNYRNVSGYVELEFTESVVGFWGMRFPTDRIAGPTTTQTAGLPAAAVPKTTTVAPHAAGPAVMPPAAGAPPKPVHAVPTPVPAAPKPVAPAVPVGAKPAAPIAAQVQPSAASVLPPAKQPEAPTHPAPTIAGSLASSVASLLSSPEVPPAAASTKPSTPPAPQSSAKPVKASDSGDASTEELRQQAARLQEQLSSMLFSATPPAKAASPSPVSATPVVDAKPATNTAAKVLEIAKPEVPAVAPVKPITAAKPAPPPIKSSFDTEEVKIPSWLEPLARNAAAPASTQELIDREKAKHAAEIAAREEIKPEPLAAAPPVEVAAEPELSSVGNLPPLEEPGVTEQQASGSSKKGLWIGIAAAVVLAVAGGGWYFTHPTSALRTASAPATRTANASATSSAPTLPGVQPATQNTVAASPSISKPNAAQPASNAPVSRPTSMIQPVPPQREGARNAATTVPASAVERVLRPVTAPATPPQPEAKKPSLGEVHLGSPTLNRSGNAQEDTAAAPTIGSPDAAGANLNSGLVPSNAKQPAAPEVPLPVGGDVKPAKLLSPVAPIYPAMAKAQHISGDVTIDALIDATGKVTTMKVLSGPALLRQAAMDALRQWKYQGASLDGKPVPMHLNVTVQFRLE